MMKKYKILKFDSDLFGYKVALINSELDALELGDVIKTLKNRGIKLAYLITSPSNKLLNQSALKFNGKLVDERVTLLKKINKNTKKIDLKIKSHIGNKPTRSIYALVYQAGIFSRFYEDNKFTNEEYKKLYKVWIDKSLDRSIAFEVLLYEDDRKYKGLITLEKKGKKGNIGILVVDSNFRRKSIGEKLIEAAIIKFSDKMINQVTVTTQLNNENAVKFYKKFGFNILNVNNVYHFWLYE